MKRILFFALLCISIQTTKAQTGIGTNEPNSESVLHIDSSTKGVLFPKVALTNPTTFLAGVTPTSSHDGMFVFNTNPVSSTGLNGIGFYYWTGGASGSWIPLGRGVADEVSIHSVFTQKENNGSFLLNRDVTGEFQVLFSNLNATSSITLNLTTNDVTFNQSGISVSAVSPSGNVSIPAQSNLIITYDLTGTTTSSGTLTGVFSKETFLSSDSILVDEVNSIDDYLEPTFNVSSNNYDLILSPVTGRIWLDRNLGSTSRSTNRSNGFGIFLNWNDALLACPTGFRLPTRAEFLLEAFDDANVAFNNLFIPSNGWSNSGVSVNATNVGNDPVNTGTLWTIERVSTTDSYELTLNNTSTYFNNRVISGRRANCRCIKDN